MPVHIGDSRIYVLKASVIVKCVIIIGCTVFISSCNSRLYTKSEICNAGLRISTDSYEVTFSKNQVLYSGDEILKKTEHPEVRNNLTALLALYAADSARLIAIPDYPTSSLLNEKNLNHFLLFGYIDRSLIKKKKFCVLDKATGRYLPWVKLKHYRDSEHVITGILAPNGRVIYSFSGY
jgi:hypothetical protein